VTRTVDTKRMQLMKEANLELFFENVFFLSQPALVSILSAILQASQLMAHKISPGII